MSGLRCDRPVLYTGRNDGQVAGAQPHRLGVLHLYAELTVPTEEQLFLFVVMPGKLAFQQGNANDGTVHLSQVGRLPWSGQGSYGPGKRDRSLLHIDERSENRFIEPHECRLTLIQRTEERPDNQSLEPVSCAMISLQVGQTG